MSSPLPIHPSSAQYITRPIDNTALDAYMKCPRFFLYSMVQNWRREGEKPALSYGTTWHKILETHYKSGGDRLLVELEAKKSWGEHGNADDHRTLARALSAYDAYLARWGDFETESKNWGSTVGYPEAAIIECATELSWEGALHPYTGKIDRVFEHQGLFYVEDHKTTSALGTYYFSQFDPSNQMMGYAWLAQLLTGLPIAGVRINAHGVLKKENKFERRVMMYSPERLAEWGRNLNAWVKRINTSMMEYEEYQTHYLETPEVLQELLLDAFPHNFNACAAKYGQCQYTEVCTMPARLRERVLATDFKQLAWNPLALEAEEQTDA